VRIRANHTDSNAMSAEFSALTPDNRWDSSNGFLNYNYTNGSDLNAIPRQGTPVPWDITATWAKGSWYVSPDISNLVQARIDNANYETQDERGKYFGLVLAYVSGNYYRTATQEPYNDALTTELHVEWTPGPPPLPSTEVSAEFSIADFPQEDTYASTGKYNDNFYNHGYGSQSFGYSFSSWYTSYWRWAITIPRGATITSAYVKLRSNALHSDVPLNAAFQTLIPDGKWEMPHGFDKVNYLLGTNLTAIPRQGNPVPWNNVPGWTGGTWFYSPDITSLVQQRIDNENYDPDSSEGCYFGLVLYHVSGSQIRAGTQEPYDNTYTAKLCVRWTYCDPNAPDICGDGIDNNCNGEVDESCNACPIANAGPDVTPFVGETIQLDGSASTDMDGNPLNYRWNILSKPAASLAQLSDANAVMPSLSVDCRGEYIIELVVSDGACESEPDTVILNTRNSCPSANAGPDQSIHVSRPVFLDGGASRDVDEDVLTYQWVLVAKPEGSAAALSVPTGRTTAFAPDMLGDYEVELRVFDGVCESEPDVVRVSTENVSPIAEAGLNLSGFTGQLVQLDGSGSYDPDDDALSFFWAVLSQPLNLSPGMLVFSLNPLLSDPTSPAPFLAPQLEGDYVLQLIVNDGYAPSEPDTCLVQAIAQSYSCPKGYGFWKNHADVWPVNWLVLGNVLYEKAELLNLLKTPVRGDASLILAHQLIANKLNLYNGSEQQPILQTMNEADDLLRQYPGALPYNVKPSTQAGAQMTEKAGTLDSYNQGLLTTECVAW
jgi:hypothetical protein